MCNRLSQCTHVGQNWWPCAGRMRKAERMRSSECGKNVVKLNKKGKRETRTFNLGMLAKKREGRTNCNTMSYRVPNVKKEE